MAGLRDGGIQESGQRRRKALVGPNLFQPKAPFKDWDIEPRLGEIRAPTLVTAGAYDEVVPEVARAVHRGIPRSRWLLFKQCSSMPYVEEALRYRKVVSGFLQHVEKRL